MTFSATSTFKAKPSMGEGKSLPRVKRRGEGEFPHPSASLPPGEGELQLRPFRVASGLRQG